MLYQIYYPPFSTMTKKAPFSFILVLIILNSTFAQVENYEPLEIDVFPKAEIGFKQVYITVPEEEKETNFKIEVFIGKELLLDCNQHFLLGEINEYELEGWGYNYYIINSKGEIASTKMACLDNETKKKFVHLSPKLFSYNSKLPIVFYIPENFIVKYKIFNASDELLNAKFVELKQDSPQLGSIAYQIINNYFVKNTVKKAQKRKIENQKEFAALFGSATTMGENGKPTSIDFKKQNVVAIIGNTTNYNTSFEITGVAMGTMGTLIVSYKINKGEKMTYAIRPFTAITIDKNQTGKVIFKEIK